MIVSRGFPVASAACVTVVRCRRSDSDPQRVDVLAAALDRVRRDLQTERNSYRQEVGFGDLVIRMGQSDVAGHMVLYAHSNDTKYCVSKAMLSSDW